MMVYSKMLEKRDAEKVLSELHDGPTGGTLRWRYHYTQNPQRWILLALLIQIFSCICKEIPTMSKFSRKREENHISPTSSDCRTSISTMGARRNRGNQSQFLPAAQIHPEWPLTTLPDGVRKSP
jgi:hypothetical protein